jgi:putative transposase
MILDINTRTEHGVRRICEVLGLSRSSFYHAAKPTPTQRADEEIGALVEEIFRRHKRNYGYRRIAEELRDQDVHVSNDRIRRIMKTRGLIAIQPKNFIPRTSDGRADKPSKNLLADGAFPEAPNQAWAGDITYIPTSKGWVYLAIVIDLYTRKVVGWSLADHMRSELVLNALDQALRSNPKNPGRIFHSDRGSQYGSKVYRIPLEKAGIRQSMSRRANPYDNAWTESMIGTLKAEMLRGGCFESIQDAQTELFSYLESYYNTQRKHSSLGYQTPAEFEAQFFSKN